MSNKPRWTSMGLRDALRSWWHGEYLDDDRHSSLVILPGILHRHWTARAARAMLEYARENHRWLIGTLIGAAGVILAALKLG